MFDICKYAHAIAGIAFVAQVVVMVILFVIFGHVAQAWMAFSILCNLGAMVLTSLAATAVASRSKLEEKSGSRTLTSLASGGVWIAWSTAFFLIWLGHYLHPSQDVRDAVVAWEQR